MLVSDLRWNNARTKDAVVGITGCGYNTVAWVGDRLKTLLTTIQALERERKDQNYKKFWTKEGAIEKKCVRWLRQNKIPFRFARAWRQSLCVCISYVFHNAGTW